jgi:hypothetical protein
MKKTFTLNIAEPCSEDFSKMTKNQTGSHCDLCNKTVLDFTGKTNREVAAIISKQKDKNSICAKVSPIQLQQEYSYNTNANFNNLKHAMLFGATVLTTIASYSQEKPTVVPVKNDQTEMLHGIVGKIAMPQKQIVTILISGDVRDLQTKKVLSKDNFSNFKLFYNETEKEISVNSKTGKFEMKLQIPDNATSVDFYSKYYEFTEYLNIPISKEEIKSIKIYKTIFINTAKKYDDNILGGLGINYIDEKVLSERKV